MSKFNKKEFRRRLVLLLLFPFLYLFIFIFRILPISWVRAFSVFVGRGFFRFAKKSRERALSNLEMVYGDTKTAAECEQMAKAVFIEQIKSFFDYMAYSHLTNKKKYFSLVEVKGEEHLQEAYKKSKGVICLIPHLSSWEFSAITPPMLGYQTWAASKSMKSPLLEKMMVKYRGRRGMKNITREGSYEKLIETLNQGDCLVLMIDQDTKVKGVFVDFLGKKAYTPTGVSRLAMETGASVVPMYIHRKEDDNYCFTICPELPLVLSGDTELDLLSNTQRQTNAIEEMVLAYPEQWVWMHRRWKTTPETLVEYRRQKQKMKLEKPDKNT